MPVGAGREDLRSIKTEKALDVAMLSLLEIRNFRKITVKELCDTALVSRATFYAHFPDKYALLKDWLVLKPDTVGLNGTYEQVEKTVNEFIYKNQAVIKNLISSADNETIEILFDSILSTMGLEIEKYESYNTSPRFVVLSSFYTGGIYQYLLWQVRNRFPQDVAPMNTHLYSVMEKFQDWFGEILEQ